MLYLSKGTVLSAYNELSKLTDDPNAQGATQVTSCLRYLFALDRFYKKNGRPCNTQRKDDKDEFIEYVGDVVSVNSSLYTVNFYNSLNKSKSDSSNESNSKSKSDYSVGSNFFSVNVVKRSLDSTKEFDYPQRGSSPLFVVQDGTIIERKNYLKNIDKYLHSSQLKCAFALWLTRNMPYVENDLYGSIERNLKSLYSEALVSSFLLSESEFKASFNITLSDQRADLNESDFPKVPETKESTGIKVLPKEELIKKVRESFELFLLLTNKQMDNRKFYLDELDNRITGLIKVDYPEITSVYEIVSTKVLMAHISKVISKDKGYEYLLYSSWNEIKDKSPRYNLWTVYRQYLNFLSVIEASDFRANITDSENKVIAVASSSLTDQISQYLRCMRTKPFLLLAGISGTGKSRIVKQFAYDSCPSEKGLDADPISPGNYCLIEVKPNWHDSTELLGYESALNKSYHLTPFVKFLVKAMCHPHVPFFVCLDEMNLAPVEQYFAEFLSVLESRKTEKGIITSEPLIDASIFIKYEDGLKNELCVSELSEKPEQETEYKVLKDSIYPKLMDNGLRLPPNLIVIGTVNMDETTHQFSRKVIDRAMTIEMNIGEGTAPFQQFFDGYQELGYRENPLPAELFLPTVTSADEALRKKLKAEDAEFLKQHVPTLLNDLNTALNNTPFKVAYRVQNELVLYFAALRQDYPDKLAEELLRQAMDDILMMKVLPRIQGDDQMLKAPLDLLTTFASSHNYLRATEKIKEISGRLEQQQFTSFWP